MAQPSVGLMMMVAAALSGCTSRVDDLRDGSTVCSVHGDTLRDDTVPIAYGLFPYDKEAIDARTGRFPHAKTSVGGGCIVSNDSPTHALVSYCPACRTAEEQWEKQREQEQEQERERDAAADAGSSNEPSRY